MKILIIISSKGVGLEVNAGRTEHMLLSRHQKAGQDHDTKIGKRSFKYVSQFKYSGTTVTNQNLIQEELR
jgi:hypothetical protein